MFFSQKIGRSDFFYFFGNLNRIFGTLGIKIVKIWFQIRTWRPRIRLYANFGKFGCIISLKNKRLACFFGHPVCLSFFLYLFIYMSVYLSFFLCMFVYMSVCLSLFFLYFFTYLSVCLSVLSYTCSYICLYVCLFYYILSYMCLCICHKG